MKWISLIFAFTLMAPVFATHTAASIFGILQTAFEQEQEDYFLLQSGVYFFENENDQQVIRISGELSAEYKIVVVSDGEILENVDITITDTGRVVYNENEPNTIEARASFTSGGGQILIRLIAKDMPSNQGYAGVLVLKK